MREESHEREAKARRRHKRRTEKDREVIRTLLGGQPVSRREFWGKITSRSVGEGSPANRLMGCMGNRPA